MDPIRLIESYGLGEILLAVVAAVGTYFGGTQFVLAFAAGVVVAMIARSIDTYDVRRDR